MTPPFSKKYAGSGPRHLIIIKGQNLVERDGKSWSGTACLNVASVIQTAPDPPLNWDPTDPLVAFVLRRFGWTCTNGYMGWPD